MQLSICHPFLSNSTDIPSDNMFLYLPLILSIPICFDECTWNLNISLDIKKKASANGFGMLLTGYLSNHYFPHIHLQMIPNLYSYFGSISSLLCKVFAHIWGGCVRYSSLLINEAFKYDLSHPPFYRLEQN